MDYCIAVVAAIVHIVAALYNDRTKVAIVESISASIVTYCDDGTRDSKRARKTGACGEGTASDSGDGVGKGERSCQPTALVERKITYRGDGIGQGKGSGKTLATTEGTATYGGNSV